MIGLRCSFGNFFDKFVLEEVGEIPTLCRNRKAGSTKTNFLPIATPEQEWADFFIQKPSLSPLGEGFCFSTQCNPKEGMHEAFSQNVYQDRHGNCFSTGRLSLWRQAQPCCSFRWVSGSNTNCLGTECSNHQIADCSFCHPAQRKRLGKIEVLYNRCDQFQLRGNTEKQRNYSFDLQRTGVQTSEFLHNVSATVWDLDDRWEQAVRSDCFDQVGFKRPTDCNLRTSGTRLAT